MDDIERRLMLEHRAHQTVYNDDRRRKALFKEAADEIGRLRDVIDCGCNAIRDAVALGGGDIKRIDAMQRRMRREMSPQSPNDPQEKSDG